MYKSLWAIGFAVASFNAAAAFSCEQIKDKPTRSACIADRKLKEEAEAAQVAKAKLDAEAKATQDAEQKRVSDFVKTMQALLTASFKDPSSAQFTDLAMAETPFKVLCGKVNAKNSYGGYVGVKPFYVRILGDMTDKRIVEPPKDSSYLAIHDAELKVMASVCQNTKPFP